jgi:glycosyltransferase involved in cell wall biosynthesis
MDDSFFTTLLLVLFSRLNHIRYISGMHIPKSFLFGFESSTHSNLKPLWHIYKYFLRVLYKGFIDNVHILNKSQEKDLKSLNYTGNIYLTPNYINIEREEVFVNKSDFIVLFTANINVKIKGVDLLCDIIETTLLKTKDIKFKITGQSGDGVDLINKLVDKYPNNVLYLGFVSDMKLTDLLKTASLSILTSRLESFPLSVLRSQAYGLPVIAFDITGPNEIVVNDVQGELIKPFDTIKFSEAIVKYYNIWKRDVLRYLKLKQNIQSIAYENFGKDKMLKELISMLTGETLPTLSHSS